MLFPREHLVAALHWRDICYLAPTPQGDEPHLTDRELIIGMASSRDGRLRFALAGLLLRHPEVAEAAADMVQHQTVDIAGTTARRWSQLEVPDAAWDEIRRQYIAAAYLQRLWRTRLLLAHGPSPLIPERFVHEMGLPAADEMNGERGLRALTEDSEFNDWSSYEQVIDMICEQPCATQTPFEESGD
ncbi:MAG: hypothetical protein NTZ50_10995 [Chloroflexi bacterium]|nr:hypothetical protein [Chloroflexota bacterium]